ncbi:phosphate-starvation-inducible PsiE family protein [Chloroflexota bacterium]
MWVLHARTNRVELIETIRIYIEERIVRVEVILLVSIIVVARKVIIMDIKAISSLTCMGIGVVVIALASECFLI